MITAHDITLAESKRVEQIGMLATAVVSALAAWPLSVMADSVGSSNARAGSSALIIWAGLYVLITLPMIATGRSLIIGRRDVFLAMPPRFAIAGRGGLPFCAALVGLVLTVTVGFPVSRPLGIALLAVSLLFIALGSVVAATGRPTGLVIPPMREIGPVPGRRLRESVDALTVPPAHVQQVLLVRRMRARVIGGDPLRPLVERRGTPDEMLLPPRSPSPNPEQAAAPVPDPQSEVPPRPLWMDR